MLKNLWVSKKRQFVSFPGDRNRGTVSRLFPYSNYKLEMVVTNGRGDGPRSETKEFPTPEGGTSPQGVKVLSSFSPPRCRINLWESKFSSLELDVYYLSIYGLMRRELCH